jgi:hypothetical protein
MIAAIYARKSTEQRRVTARRRALCRPQPTGLPNPGAKRGRSRNKKNLLGACPPRSLCRREPWRVSSTG